MEKRYSNISQNKGEVSGYVVRWNNPAYVEEIGKKEMFLKNSLDLNRNIALYAQHDPTRVLATTKSGTLKLSENNEGLKFTAQLPKSAVDTRELLERGDLSGASAGFHTDSDQYVDGMRQIKKARLSEISLVHDPAYQNELAYRSKTKTQKKKWTDLL